MTGHIYNYDFCVDDDSRFCDIMFVGCRFKLSFQMRNPATRLKLINEPDAYYSDLFKAVFVRCSFMSCHFEDEGPKVPHGYAGIPSVMSDSGSDSL